MKKIRQTPNFLGLAVGLLLLIALGSVLGDKHDQYALIAGYFLFGINYLLLATIYHKLVLASQGGGLGGRGRSVVLLASLMKFASLIGLLYLLLIVFRLSGFYVAAGSLGSLFVITVVLIANYLRGLSSGLHTE